MALITIEAMDLIFAVDSIPAIFSITQDSFIIYSSNIFAILGLRALFFCLVDIVERFKYIKYSLAIILILIGIKIIVSHIVVIPKILPLIVTIILILIGVIVSIIKDKEPLRNFASKEWVGEEEAALVAGMDQLGEVVEKGSQKI
jgi:tellurite resistance protein TerC